MPEKGALESGKDLREGCLRVGRFMLSTSVDRVSARKEANKIEGLHFHSAMFSFPITGLTRMALLPSVSTSMSRHVCFIKSLRLEHKVVERDKSSYL